MKVIIRRGLFWSSGKSLALMLFHGDNNIGLSPESAKLICSDMIGETAILHVHV